MNRTIMTVLLGLFLVGSVALAAVPETFSYQGVLTDASGQAVPNGNYNLTLSLYNVAFGGSALWTEAQLTAVNNGVFNVILGSVVPITIAFDEPLFLGVAVAGGAELSPRTSLTASPYSLNSPAMAFTSSGATTTIGTSWTNYDGEHVTLYCPAPGYVVVTSTAWLLIDHTSGTEDRVEVAHDTTATGEGPRVDFWSTYQVDAGAPSNGELDITLPVQTVIQIAAAGSYTFYLNAMMETGQSSGDEFWYAGTTATWYPASSAVTSAASMRGAKAALKAKRGAVR